MELQSLRRSSATGATFFSFQYYENATSDFNLFLETSDELKVQETVTVLFPEDVAWSNLKCFD